MDEIQIASPADHVAVVTLDRPERRNALTEPIFHHLTQTLLRLDADDDVRVIVLRGSGKYFCTGADVHEVDIAGGWGGAPMVDPAEDAYVPLQKISTPLIGCINGAVAGGGLALALVCDVRIVAESARFVASFSRLGVAVNDSIGWYLPRILGLARSYELLYAKDPIGAQDALRLGLANSVVPDDELEAHTLEYATHIASLAPVALRLTKRVLAESLDQSLADYLRYQSYAYLINRTVGGADIEEGVAAFLAKRPPEFRGGHLSARFDTDYD